MQRSFVFFLVALGSWAFEKGKGAVGFSQLSASSKLSVTSAKRRSATGGMWDLEVVMREIASLDPLPTYKLCSRPVRKQLVLAGKIFVPLIQAAELLYVSEDWLWK